MDLNSLSKYDLKFSPSYKRSVYLGFGIRINKSRLTASTRLQQSIDKEAINGNPQSSVNDDAPYDKHVVSIYHNRLWKIFRQKLMKSGQNQSKQEIDILRVRAKIWDSIILEQQNAILKKKQLIKNNLIIIKKKYRQSHSLYEEIKRIKKHELQIQSRIRNQSISQSNDTIENQKSISENSSRYIPTRQQLLNTQLQQIHSELEALEKTQGLMKDQLEKKIEELINFFRILLMKGFYRYDGLKWILQKMAEFHYVPKISDFPTVLDSKSQQCLMLQYQNMKDKQNYREHLPQLISKSSRIHQNDSSALSTQRLKIMTKNQELREIYKQTGNCLASWIRKKGWKCTDGNRQYLCLPKTMYIWKEAEKKRIKQAYPQSVVKQIQKMLFGLKNIRQTRAHSSAFSMSKNQLKIKTQPNIC